MADNVNLPLTGSGDSTAAVAAEEIGGVHYQRVKLINASAGSTVAATLASTTVDANLTSAGSTKLFGINNYESFTISSRTSVASSVDVSLFPSDTNARCRIINNHATAIELLVRLSTVAVTTASGGSDIKIPANSYLVMGGQTGNMPLYTGPVRVKLNSTAVAAAAIGLQFTT